MVNASQPREIGIVVGGSVAVRCRKIEGYTPTVNAEETGQQAADNWYTVVNAVGDAASKIGFGIGTGVGLAALGAVLFLIVTRR